MKEKHFWLQDFAMQLKRVRQEAGLTQKEVSDGVFKNAARISRVENGHDSITLNTLFKILESINGELMIVTKEERIKIEQYLIRERLERK